jgi:hypothetical protein
MDSPFADFSKLAKELCLKQVPKLPGFLVDAAMSIVNRSVKKKNGLDIYKLRPIDCAGKTTIPAFFIHALNDELINIEHSIELCDKYGGEKSLNSCKGGHNSIRPRDVVDKVGDFFAKYLCDGNIDDIEEDSFKNDFGILNETYKENGKDIGHSQDLNFLKDIFSNIKPGDLEKEKKKEEENKKIENGNDKK